MLHDKPCNRMQLTAKLPKPVDHQLKTLINLLHGFEECKPLKGEQPAKEVIPAWSRHTVEEMNDLFFDLKLIKCDHCSRHVY